MAESLDLRARLRLDSSDFDRGLDRSGFNLKRFAGAAAGAFAALKVGSFIKDSIGAASDFSESMSKVGVVFGESSTKIKAFADSAATSLGQSRQQALEATGTFGNLLIAVGLNQREAADMSVEFTKLASDLASFNNTDVQEALNALRSGLVGETEPLKRFGVNLNQASIEAKALSLGLVRTNKNMAKIRAAELKVTDARKKLTEVNKKHGTASNESAKASAALALAEDALGKATEGTAEKLTTAQKAQAAYALVMEQTKIQQGDFGRTSHGLAGQQKILASQFADLKVAIGTPLMGAVLTLVGAFREGLLPRLKEIGDSEAFQKLKDKAVEFFPKIKKAITDENIPATLAEMVRPLTHTGDVPLTLDDFVTTWVENWKIVGAELEEAVNGEKGIKRNTDALAEDLRNLLPIFREVFPELKSIIVDFFETIGRYLAKTPFGMLAAFLGRKFTEPLPGVAPGQPGGPPGFSGGGGGGDFGRGPAGPPAVVNNFYGYPPQETARVVGREMAWQQRAGRQS